MYGIKLSSVIFKYGRDFTLDIDALEIPKGVLTVIAGKNGAGKTTLLKLIAGIAGRHEGSITVDGGEIEKISNTQRTKMFSYVPQSEEQEFAYTVKEIAAMGRRPHGSVLGFLNPKDIKAVDKALESADMADKSGREFRTLSGGEKRLALLARAAAQDAGTMLLDEPSAFLDIGHQAKVYEIIRGYRDEGRTVIMVTHDINAVFETADNVVLMNKGSVMAAGAAEDVLSENNIKEAYAFDGFGLSRNQITGKNNIFLKI
ncbi:MAG: ABC transporter ATP-binding protein [Candidatus Goldbacteria bacterium]|nr:ABC transporter ATP-binding protein [Candidatus Goldiibacteriota bacterium]